MRNFKKNLLKFSNGYIHSILMLIFKTWVWLRAREIRKCFYRLHILMFSLDTCVCLRMVEDREFSAFQEKKTTPYYSMLLYLLKKLYTNGIAVSY